MTSRPSPLHEPAAPAPTDPHDDLRARVTEKLAALRERRSRRVAPTPPPRYDEEFFKFLGWLDTF